MEDSAYLSLLGNAQAFPVLQSWDFFNHAGVSPLPQAAADAMRTVAAQATRSAYLGNTWYHDVERLRDSAAALLNAHRDEVAFVKNTSEGLATVAFGLDWRPGDRVVLTNVEYPANIYPWMEAARRFGIEPVLCEETTQADGTRRVSLNQILERAGHHRTRLVSLSHVEYASGQRHELQIIGQFCRDHGKLLCVDGIQSLGALPVDVRAMHIDYLSADGHKWLLGPEGAGIFYCRRELLEQTRPLVVGWMNVVNAEDYGNYDYTLKASAARFECGTHNIVGLMGLRASMDLLCSVGIERIAARIKVLTDRLVAGLLQKGYRTISPREAGCWSGIVSFSSEAHDPILLWRMLRKDHRVELAVREGRMRVSPHFYNTEKQMDRLLELLPGH